MSFVYECEVSTLASIFKKKIPDSLKMTNSKSSVKVFKIDTYR